MVGIKSDTKIPDDILLKMYNNRNAYLTIKTPIYDEETDDYYGEYEFKINENAAASDSFIERNKEYEQSKEIIEEWKKVNNIQYNPEEIYSRGQEFSSVVGAYSEFDVNLMMQNLLSHIEDNEKAGGKFAISAYTKPIDKQIGHLEGGGGKIKFKLYPQSNDILWAANTDVYSGSVWDASEKVNKDKKSELLGVSYTKYPSLSNVNTVQPNLAAIVDDLAHHHNELGITLTGNNFRLEYDEDIPYTTKKIIDGINKILDQKYGKLIKPEISKVEKNKSLLLLENELEILNNKKRDLFLNNPSAEDEDFEEINDEIWQKEAQVKHFKKIESLDKKTTNIIQPTQTKDNTTSIESVREEIVGEVQNTLTSEDVQFELNDSLWVLRGTTKYPKFIDVWKGGSGEITKEDYINFEDLPKKAQEFFKDKIQLLNKEYTSQALINTKIAALKDISKKYPRSLIRSEVKPINRFDTKSYEQFDELEDLPFQKVPKKVDFNDLIGSKKNEVIVKEGVNDIFQENPELSKIGNQQQYSQYLNTIFPNSQVKDIVYHGTRFNIKNKKFDIKKAGSATLGFSGAGFFTNNKEWAEERFAWNDSMDDGTQEGNFVFSAILDIKSPTKLNTVFDFNKSIEEGFIENLKQYFNREISRELPMGRIFSEGGTHNNQNQAIFNFNRNTYDYSVTYINPREKQDKEINLYGSKSIQQIPKRITKEEFENSLNEKSKETYKKSINKINNLFSEKKLDIKKALELEKLGTKTPAIVVGSDSVISKQSDEKTLEYAVFESEQIHILGSNQDIKDFKEFVDKNKVESENNEVVDETEDFSKENNKVLFNDKSKVTVDEVLDNIINNFNDLSPIGKELVTKAKNLKNKTGANVKFVKESVLETENTVMQIDAKTNTIEISKERLAKVNSKIAVESFLHELGHAQSLQALINPVTFEEKQFAELINKMFKWYSDLSNGSDSYGFTNEAEFVSELYTNKAFQDEIRALDVEENISYWKQFIDAVRRLFGLAKSKQSDLLIEQIITFVESDRTNYTGIGDRRIVFAKRIEDDSQYSSLESKLDNFNVAAKKAMITIQEKTVRSNRKKPTEAKEDRIRENKELLDTLDKYSKVQKWKAVIGYTQSFNNTINHVEKLLNELLSTKNIYEDKLDLTIKRYKDYLSAYDLLPQIKELMSQADLKLFELTDEEKEDYQQLKDFLVKAKEKHDAIESKFLAISKAQVMQDFSNPLYNTEVETKQREFLLREYNSLSDKGGLTADQYVSKMLVTRDKDDYQADLKSSAEKILNDPSQDISWFSAKAEDNLNTKSKLIQVVNQMLVESFDKVKSLTVDKVHKMAKTFEKFIKEKGNVKLSELNKNLIERDSEGNVYLKGVYSIKFKEAFDKELRPVLKARQEYIEESIMLGLDENDYLNSKKFKEFNYQISQWYKKHTTKDSNRKTVPKAKYLNKPLTGTEKEILDSYIKINDDNDDIEGFQSLVTDIIGARFYKLPSQSKTDLERALELDIKGITKDKWNDLTKVRTDDIGLQTGKEDKNSQGEIINRVKTHYRGKIDPNEQSLDLETMFRNEYWNGQNYKEKSRLEPKLLMITDIAKDKEYYTGKNKDIVPGLSNTYNRLVGMMERNVYDIMSKHGGNWGQVDINKVTNALNGYAAGLAMTLNKAASTTNIMGGLTDIFIEAVGSHRFNVATFAKAEAKYTKEVLNGNILKDNYTSVKMSYFNQLLDMFDVMGGLGQNEQEALRNNIARKFGTTRSGNILNDMGEHAMHSILTQSLLDGIKAMDENNNYLDKDGNITTEAKGASLADMLYFDSEGILKMNPKVAYSKANLTVKYDKGGKSQINALIKHKVMDLFGVYDIKYQSEFSKTVAGKWLMLFKKFFLSKAAYRYTGFMTSYKKKDNLTEDDRFYNSAEKEYIEGTYTTFVRFLRETGIPNLQMLQTMYMNWKNLSEYEKSNVKKATMEIMLTSVILPSLGLLMAGMDDDDDDNNLLWFFIYVNRRLTRELAQFRNPIEAAKMIQNPIAGIRFIQNGLNFIYDVITPVNFVPGDNEAVFGYLDENSKGENKMWDHATKLVPILPQLGVDYKQRHSLEFK